MQYHIQTTPIWDAFKKDCDCPLCEIYANVEARLVSQYLNEAVMEPDYRIKVNKYGFCVRHLTKLYEGKNKLGLALQLETRTAQIIKELEITDNLKKALKQAEHIENGLTTCVICDSCDEMMNRYAYTIAQMYSFEEDFPKIFKASHGFCLPHYALVLKNSGKAGKKQAEYLLSLTELQKRALEGVNNQTVLFTQRFDYRNAGSGGAGSSDAVKNAINKIKGKIV